MIAAWKLKREWNRAKMQLEQWHWFLFGAMRRRRYDQTRKQTVIYSEGARPMAADVAILLIYQPKGLLHSLYLELDYLHAKGIATIVVSNAPIARDDLERLQSHCHLVLQRPNYGYDFGGYRDGVLTLFERGINPQNLFILNDSVWFPLNVDSTLIDQARQSAADLFGIYYNERPKTPQRSHLQSYFYRFNRQLVISAAFETYWRELTLTNNKYMVVRQCEIKLTYAMQAQGFSIDFLFNNASLKSAILALNDVELYDMVRYQVQVDTRLAATLTPLIAEGPLVKDWRTKIEALVGQGRVGKYFLILHPLVLLRELASPILKKDRQPMYQLQRQELFRYGLAQGFSQSLLDEMTGWDDQSSS